MLSLKKRIERIKSKKEENSNILEGKKREQNLKNNSNYMIIKDFLHCIIP